MLLKKLIFLFGILTFSFISTISFADDAFCSDFDNGRKFYEKGTTTNNNLTKTDYCNESNIIEYYCNANTKEIEESSYHCSVGCVDGACISPKVCGNNVCEDNEDCSSCSTDCGICVNETPQITTTCGDGICENNETSTNCPIDCQSVDIKEETPVVENTSNVSEDLSEVAENKESLIKRIISFVKRLFGFE